MQQSHDGSDWALITPIQEVLIMLEYPEILDKDNKIDYILANKKTITNGIDNENKKEVINTINKYYAELQA